MTEPVIEVDRLSCRIGEKTILDEVSFSVGRGERLVIIGPNGAGKTTLLRCLDRILARSGGEVRVFGQPLESYSQKALARLISFVPQAARQQFPFTVHEFVMMGRYPHLSPFSSITPQDEQQVRQAMDLAGVTELADRLIGTLSGGETQKVLIAAALAQGARILLLDEPTTFLDYKHQEEVERLLLRINREAEATLISVTHDINTAVLTGERVIALRAGRIVFTGPACDVMNNEVLERIYGKTFLFSRHPLTGRPIVVPQELYA